MRDSIRWFKCKLKPPNNIGDAWFGAIPYSDMTLNTDSARLMESWMKLPVLALGESAIPTKIPDIPSPYSPSMVLNSPVDSPVDSPISSPVTSEVIYSVICFSYFPNFNVFSKKEIYFIFRF